jgi:hypothetical protein
MTNIVLQSPLTAFAFIGLPQALNDKLGKLPCLVALVAALLSLKSISQGILSL